MPCISMKFKVIAILLSNKNQVQNLKLLSQAHDITQRQLEIQGMRNFYRSHCTLGNNSVSATLSAANQNNLQFFLHDPFCNGKTISRQAIVVALICQEYTRYRKGNKLIKHGSIVNAASTENEHIHLTLNLLSHIFPISGSTMLSRFTFVSLQKCIRFTHIRFTFVCRH